MGYYGYQPSVGEHNDTFKILDDISSYTLTFDGSSAAVVSAGNDTITYNSHRFVQGQRVTYTNGSGGNIGGLTTGTAYFVIKHDQNNIKLATNASNAAAGTAINLTAVGSGTSHTLNVAFDGTNTKFTATYDNGTKAKVTKAGQLQISVNGVIQQPYDNSSPTNGFGIDSDAVLIFSTAPSVGDDFWGYAFATNTITWEVTDNKVDTYTATGTQTDFVLTRTPATNENVLVTLDGVVQYPSDNTTTRAYKLISNVLVFTSAPASGVAVQVRHIGFAAGLAGGSGSGGVTNFYGRTGAVALTSSDDVTLRNLTATDGTFSGNVSIAGTLTYEDVTNFDSVGLATARTGLRVTAGGINVSAGISTFGATVDINDTTQSTSTTTGSLQTLGGAGIVKNLNVGGNTLVGSGITMYASTGIVSATGFRGDGTYLTGVSAGYLAQDSVGVTTVTSVGVNTTTLNDSDLVGAGSSFQGLYISNGMMVTDNALNGNHYIGTAFNGLMAGPVTINGVLTIDGNYVVV